MIYAIGDSFTYGDELPSQNLAWPSILAKRLNKKIINQGKCATGNHRIVKRTIDAVLDKAEMLILGWTDCNRLEFADDKGIYDIWAGRNYKAFQFETPQDRITLIKYLTAYDLPEYNYANWLRQVILVQNLCKANQIPCVMFNACGSYESHIKYHKKFPHLVAAIDDNYFVDGMFVGVGHWTYKLPHGPNGHPLQEGHHKIADKIYGHIRNKYGIS
jgi:hypothetical protein